MSYKEVDFMYNIFSLWEVKSTFSMNDIVIRFKNLA